MSNGIEKMHERCTGRKHEKFIVWFLLLGGCEKLSKIKWKVYTKLIFHLKYKSKKELVCMYMYLRLMYKIGTRTINVVKKASRKIFRKNEVISFS